MEDLSSITINKSFEEEEIMDWVAVPSISSIEEMRQEIKNLRNEIKTIFAIINSISPKCSVLVTKPGIPIKRKK